MIGTDTPFEDGSYLHGGPYPLAELRRRFPDLTDAQIDLRRDCIADPLFLAAEVLFGDMPRAGNLFLVPPSQHREVAQAMVDQASCLYVDHRGTLKTTLQNHVGAVWQLLKYVNDRILFLQSVIEIAKQISRTVRGSFERNRALRALFPEYAMEKSDDGSVMSWSVPCRTRLTVEGSFTIGTPETALTGLHFEVIQASDLMNPTTVPPPCGLSTVERMKSVIAWDASTQGLLVHKSQCPRAHRTYNSNRWHDGDHVGQILRDDVGDPSRGIAPYFRKVIRGVRRDADGNFIPTWPECADAKQLAAIRASPSMTAATWSANFCSDPQPDGGMSFLREWFKLYDKAPDGLRVAITCDPAFTAAASKGARKADHSALVVTGVTADNDLYVLQYLRGQWTPNDFVTELYKLCAFWKPSWVGIEERGAGVGLRAIFDLRGKQMGVRIPYRELQVPGQPKNADKSLRIFPLHCHAQHRGIFVRREHEALVDQLLRFEVSDDDDLADAIAYRAMDLYPQHFPKEQPEATPLRVVPPHRRETPDQIRQRQYARSMRGPEPPWVRDARKIG